MNTGWRKCTQEIYLARDGSHGCDLGDWLQADPEPQASILTMKPAMVLLFGLSLVFMAGCATFETTPEDVEQKLTHPTAGHLYVPDSANNPPKLAAY